MTSTMIETAQPSPNGGIVQALNGEWARLDEQQRPTVAGWSERHRVFEGCRCLADVLDVVRSQPDEGLRALLVEVGTGEQLAGRVVLQAMMGRLVQMARRDVRAGVDEYVGAMWCEITTYPLDRRPMRIAANLALDVLQSVHREHRWVVRGEVTTWPPGELLDEICHGAGAAHPGDPELESVGAREVLAAAHDLSVIDAAGHALLTSVYVDGLSGVEASQRHRSTPGSVRARCSRAVGRLQRAAPELLEVA